MAVVDVRRARGVQRHLIMMMIIIIIIIII